MARDILKTLKDEHDNLRKLFDDLEDTTDRAVKTRGDLLDEIETKLILHAKWEEKVLYPAFKGSDWSFQTKVPLMPGGRMMRPLRPPLPRRWKSIETSPAGVGMLPLARFSAPSAGVIRTEWKPGSAGRIPSTVASR